MDYGASNYPLLLLGFPISAPGDPSIGGPGSVSSGSSLCRPGSREATARAAKKVQQLATSPGVIFEAARCRACASRTAATVTKRDKLLLHRLVIFTFSPGAQFLNSSV